MQIRLLCMAGTSDQLLEHAIFKRYNEKGCRTIGTNNLGFHGKRGASLYHNRRENFKGNNLHRRVNNKLSL